MKLIKTKTASSFLFGVDFLFLAKKSSVLRLSSSLDTSFIAGEGGGGSHHFSANSPGKTVMAIFC